MAVAIYPERRQLYPGNIAAGRTKAISPAFHGRPGVNPEGVLFKKVAPHEKVGHTSKFSGIVKTGVGSARRLQGHDGADAVGILRCNGQSKIASLAMGQQDCASFHPLDQGIVGLLGERIVAVPTGNALA
jgi:hypothetical protein